MIKITKCATVNIELDFIAVDTGIELEEVTSVNIKQKERNKK